MISSVEPACRGAARIGGMKRPLLFVAIAYTLSIALSLIIGLTGGFRSPLVGLRFLSMFIPAVALMIVRSVTSEDLRIEWNRLPARYIVVAILLFPAVMHAAMLTVAVAYEGRLPWEDWLTPRADGLYHTPAQRGWGTLTPAGLARHIAVNAVVGLVIVSILAFFEEIGWRAWLLPRLVERTCPRLGVVITSAIWALWQYPLPALRRATRRRRFAGRARAYAAARHICCGAGPGLALVENRKHLDRFIGSRRTQRLGTVRVQVHAVRSGARLDRRGRWHSCRSPPWNVATDTRASDCTASGQRNIRSRKANDSRVGLVSRHILLIASVVFLIAGVLILNAACAFALLNMPLPEQVAAYRAEFYQRALLGVGCITVGIVLLRLRRRRGR
jgi:membrane protease YdiL (CAAX protease family)